MIVIKEKFTYLKEDFNKGNSSPTKRLKETKGIKFVLMVTIIGNERSLNFLLELLKFNYLGINSSLI